MDSCTLSFTQEIHQMQMGFKFEIHANGTVERYKACLAAKGFTQTRGLDYLDTFIPVVKMKTIRVLMAIAVVHNWTLFQLGLNKTFLHGDFNEKVYMKVLSGVGTPHTNIVCKLQRSLYGLKQVSRQWNTKLTNILVSTRYTQTNAGYSLFTKNSSVGFIIILVYVDDLVLGGTDIEQIRNLKALMNSKFSIKDLGVLKYFLGFKVSRNAQGISLCQRKYSLYLIHDACLIGAKPYNTPMQPHLQLHKTHGIPLSDPSAFQRLIGRLLYLIHSRPKIAYVVSKLSQIFYAQTYKHVLVGFHVLHYLKNNTGQSLFFSFSSTLYLKGFSDLDRGACLYK